MGEGLAWLQEYGRTARFVLLSAGSRKCRSRRTVYRMMVSGIYETDLRPAEASMENGIVNVQAHPRCQGVEE